MSDNTPVDTDVNLDDFSAEFFGQNKAPDEPASSEEVAPVETAEDETDTHSDDDTVANDEDASTEEAEAKEADAKPKKNRFQERIDELTTARREAERREADLKRRLDEMEAAFKQTPEPKTAATADEGPTPDALNEDGTDKYPLGEFDPKYIRDLTKFTFSQEMKARQDDEVKAKQEAEAQTVRVELQTQWQEKLGPAQERYPDFREKGELLLGTFDGLDPNYGEYLTSTLMAMDYGPDVLYYLSNHVDEAQKIVNSGAAKATIALGRIEAKFAYAEEEKQRARPKVSQAPEPPVHVNKGAAVSKTVAADTDDLDAFASQFFKKRR